MSKDVIRRDEAHVKVRGDLMVVEYPDINKDVSVVYAELNGRHPASGYIINEVSNETYLVHEGSGEIYMDGVITKFKAGDVVPIRKGTKYYCKGKNMKFWCAINPPWREPQERLIPAATAENPQSEIKRK